mgnify:CR=1 FL=1
MTVIAASRCSRRLTVNEPIVLAPLDRCEESARLPVSFWRCRTSGSAPGTAGCCSPSSRSRGRMPGSLWASPRCLRTIGGEDVQGQKDQRRQGDQVDDQDREHPRHLSVARPGALDQADGGVERAAPGRSRRPPTAESSACASARSPAAAPPRDPEEGPRARPSRPPEPRSLRAHRMDAKPRAGSDLDAARPEIHSPAVLCADFDDAPARQPRASPSPLLRGNSAGRRDSRELRHRSSEVSGEGGSDE